MSPVLTPAPVVRGTLRTRPTRSRVPTTRSSAASAGRSSRSDGVLPEALGLGQLFLRTREAVVIADVDTERIVLWNPAAQALFGYTPAEAIGQPMHMLIPPPIARLHHEALAHYRRTDDGALIGSERPIEVPALARSGEEIRVELSLVALDERPSTRRYVMALMRDASDHRRAELQALELERAKTARAEAEKSLEEHDQLLASGIDDLGQCVARLQRATARLVRTAHQLEPSRIALLARVIEARTQAVERLLSHLGDASAIQASSMELRTYRVNIVPLVNRVVAAARSRSSAHKLNVAVPQGLTVMADAARLEQVLDALIDQAMERNPRGCWIDVDLRRPLVGLARLEVRDYGRPVSAEEQQELLESNGSKHGLAVSRWVIEQHGGTFSLESPEEGGLRVIVTLPTQRGRVLSS